LKLRLTINGKIYEVEVEVIEQDRQQLGQTQPETHSPASAPVIAPGSATGPATGPATGALPSSTSAEPADESKVCRSPISGVVVRVPSQVGQTIQANDVLMVLEAMKMETVISSPVAGKISKINVVTGDSVQVRQVLVEFE
jgi:biotin carboxyl carrier protein